MERQTYKYGDKEHRGDNDGKKGATRNFTFTDALSVLSTSDLERC